MSIAVPADATDFQIGIFDGDGGEYDAEGNANWDSGVTALFEYTLSADPLGDGTGAIPVDLLPGQPVVYSDSLPDNSWADFSIPTSAEALTPSGNYFYVLRIRLLDPSLTTLNAIKIRTSATLSGLTLDPVARPFSYIASWTALSDLSTVYPAFPSPTPTTYDGTFRFYFDVPVAQSQVYLWDGDFDHGNSDLTDQDTDDPDTPGAPFTPDWSTENVDPEGVAVGLNGGTGNPADDDSSADFGAYVVRSPAVRYSILASDGQLYPNDNPSGNQEWERFRITTDFFDPSEADHPASALPPGTYQLQIEGVDMLNLNALLLPYRVLCVEEDGTPCTPLRPFRVGDRVFDSCQQSEGGEGPGIAGVTLELLDEAGNVLGTTVTDDDGNYSFPVEAAVYTVRIAESNFEPGGPLDGFVDSDGLTQTEEVVDDNVLTFDFGFCGQGSIGDRVWEDTNGNGIQDPDEPGLPDILVELLDEEGNILDQAFTDSDGMYEFINVQAGTYTVRVDPGFLPEGLTPSADLDGIATPNEAVVELGSGERREDVDFGYSSGANGSIGDRVWADTDGDGIQDAGEPGLPGVTVHLRDGDGNVVATTTTDANGLYSFESLAAGSYSVEIDATTLPAGSAPSYDLDGIGTPNTAAVALGEGQERTDVDFGYRGSASIGDRLWTDVDGDGTQDAGEPGLNGVTVELLDGDGNVVGTTTTAGDGNYTFSNLLGGTYTVRVVSSTLPAGLAPSYDLDGIGTPHVATVTVTGGAARTDVDFGYRGTGSLGDRVWYDANGNGTQDPNEDGLAGVTVELLLDGNVVTTTTTGTDGLYTFNNLAAGTYTVRVDATTLPAGAVPTYDLDGIATANTAVATLANGASRTDVDFGYRGSASVGDRVWYDVDGDGTQDAGEGGLTGVTVQLLDEDGNVLSTTTTGANGVYTFGGLLAGSYSVRIDAASLPADAVPTYDLDGVGTANTAAVTVTGTETIDTVDFGYRGTASLGDRLWNDTDGDGVQDAGETGLTGVTVELLNGDGTVVATTTTGADGLYTFGNLLAGSYTVRVVAATLPAGVAPTYDLDGIATANTAAVTLAAGANRNDVDFGYRGTGSIGDRLWNDTDGDGAQDAGETGLTGVTVELLDNGGNVVATTTTGADGIYTFDNLGAGSYTVRVVAATLPAGVAPTYDLDGIATTNTAAVTLTGGQDRTDVDFGYRGTASIGDRLWNDANGNGAQDAGEAGLTGVTVELLNNGGTVIATTTTGADGIYTFSNLNAGSYTVRVVAATLPAGSAPTYDLDGTGTANTAAVTLTGGQNRTDVDFGYRGTASIGDRLWNDANGNGAQDAGEAGLTGVTVELLNNGGTVIATTTTGADGIYTFSNLNAGSYTVRVVAATLPAGSAPTYDLDGTGTANTAAVTLTGGQNRTDVDFGYRGTASIGDRLWNDANGNGAQDAGEAGLTGVTVELLNNGGTVIATTTTGADGIYTFSNLNAGSYTVRVVAATLPAGSAPTYDLDGTGTANTAAVTLTGGQNRTDVDFGYRGTASIGDRLWNDANGNGAQDAGEAGLTGVTVELLNNGGTVIATTTTGADGIYTFSNLNAGSYTVRVVAATLPAGVAPTYDLDGIATANTAAVTLTGGQNRTDVDFGYRATGSIGDRLWNDANGNGAQDAGEAGLTGVTVELLNNGGTVIATTTTGANGVYTFNNLGAGSYTVRVVAATLPAGVAPTYDLDGIATANTAAVTLTGGQNRTDVDFGYRATGSIGDRIWNDANGNGAQDAGEAGLTGVTVELLDNGGNVIATTTTGANGAYTFNNLGAGSYTVRVVAATLPAGSAPTYDLDGTGTANTAAVTLTGGQNRTDVDFGYRGTASIGDRLWNDANGNGAQDAGEAGLTGVTVELLNNGGTVIATTTTGADGIYTFSNLNAGNYTVRVVAATLPAGVAPTYDLDGTATANTAAVTLTGGQNRTDVDFGYRATGSIGDRIWNDANGNGAQDAGEAGLTGVTVELLNNGGTVIATTTTGADGIYTFSNLNAGNYTVRVAAATLPAGVAPTYDLDGTGTANTAAVTLTGGQNRTDVDFGYRATGSIGDRIWNDANGNGAQDAGEAGLTGVTVELLNSGGTVIATTTTGANGAYTFSNLGAGNYTVRVVSSTLPAGSAPTYDLDGVATANTAAVTLTGGQTRTDVDFGYRGTGSIGDRLWDDADGDGVQDAGEAGLTGVTVELLNSGGTVIATTTTGANGAYNFANLAAGSYTVRVVSSTLPAGYTATYDLDGIATANTAAVTLTGGQTRTDVDFGYRTSVKASIGDRVWYDTDGDGVQDADEPGLEGTTVELLNSGGTVIATTTTGPNGIYTFTNLSPGTYTVRVVASTLPVGGLTPTYDIDGTGTAHTAVVTLSGTNRADVDFGYRGTRTVGDRVWNDIDGDGTQEASEAGINGVTVRLYLGTTEVASTVTAGDGNYTFSNLPEATFTVRVDNTTLPAGLVQTYDLDGTATPHQATFNLTTSRTDVDFGYRTPPVVCTAGYFKDHFNTASFSNNDGTLSWTGAWIETDTAGTGVSSGNVTVGSPYAGYLFLRNHTSATTQPSAARQVNLASAASATLSFYFHVRTAVDPTDAVVIEISNNGGSTYTILETLTGFSGTYEGTRSYNISSYIASNTRIRFRVTNGYTSSDELFKVDWVKIDAACTPKGSIGDRVWYDFDADGTQDGGDFGLGGVTVQLLNSGGTVIATATTDSNGYYNFDNLNAGTYTVRVVSSTLPVTGLTPTYDLDGTGTAHTAVVDLESGEDHNDADFGYRGTRTLGDRVWNDTDGDGVQDSSEAGINGVTVRLYLGTTEVASTLTAGNGNYSFPNLPDTTYIVRIDTATLPAGVTQTYDLDGTATPHQATVTVTASRSDVDFGYRTPPVSCTAGYFKDHFDTASFSNNDGTLSWAGAWIETDTAGTGVSSGNVTVGSPYAGYLFLRNHTSASTQPSAARQANLTGAASATLSFVFHVRTAVDPSDAVVVEISNNGGSTYTLLETLTGFTGTYEGSRSYNISSYIASNTRIRFRVTNGYTSSDELFKLDWVKIDTTCTPTSSNGSIGNRVWNDADGDGSQDSGEAGLNGLTVQLLNSSGTVIATTTTAGNGDYTFGSLAAGNYSVRVVSSTIPAGMTQTYDLDGTGSAHVAAVSLTSGQARTDVDFGYRTPPASCTAGYFKDHFNSASFSNNDGTLSWAGAWIESDSAGSGVSSGNVTVGTPYAGYLFLKDYPDSGSQPNAARQVNLAGARSATLSFTFHVRTAVDPSDAVVVEISNNGGSTYTLLETLTGFTGTYEGTRTYNISSYISSNTRIRFRVSNGYGASDELFKLDWVKIDKSCS